MKNPIVEMNGDEMTRIIWGDIKKILIEPYVELNTCYFDLGLKEREKTKDKITVEAANAILKHKVGVKCATITPNAARVKEYNLSEMWKSPNGTIRAILDGTVFRAPITVKGIKALVPNWTKPIIIARHAYGDIYKNKEEKVEKGSTVNIVIEKGKKKKVIEIASFKEKDGIIMGMHNYDDSIKSFAHSCFSFALEQKMDLWFSAKDTISKIYDHRFKDIFDEIYQKEYKSKFEKANITYFYTLIDDAIARVIRSDGGYIWACKNYDGDVMSDMVATAFGSLAMMSSVLVSPTTGAFEYEAAHGTVTRHYYRHLKGEETSTNPVATIFAWSGALNKRGELDKNKELCTFAKKLEKATLKTIEKGFMTGDLIPLFNSTNIKAVKLNTKEFLEKVKENI